LAKDGAHGFEISFQVPKVVRGSLDSLAAAQRLQLLAAGRHGQGAERGAAGLEVVCHGLEHGRIVGVDGLA